MFKLPLFLLVPLALLSQSAAQQEPPGSVEGRVTNAQTGDPIPGASLHLHPVMRGGARRMRSRQPQATTSLADGTFRFDSVPPGAYFVSAEREGFIAAGPNGSPQTISVSPGQQLTTVSIQLNPQAVITGKVMDEEGNPVSGARVEAFTTFSDRGKSQLTRRSSATANTAGEYKLKNLLPGSYYLAADTASDTKKDSQESPRPDSAHPEAGHDAVASNAGSAADATQPDLELVRTFYPKALDFESATPVEITAGQNLADTNILLRRIATYHIRGKIEAALPGNAGRNLTISLGPRNSLASDVAGTITHPNPDGTFDIPKVSPGTYTLTLTGVDSSAGAPTARASSNTKLLARQDLDVVAADVNGIVLAIIPAISLTGHVVMEGNGNVTLSRIRVNVSPAGGAAVGGFQSLAVKDDGAFAIDALDPGQYVVRIAGNPPGTYVKSISYNRQDITTAGLDLLQGGSGEIEIVLRSGAAEVQGTIQSSQTDESSGGAGSMATVVMLIPQELAPDGSGILFGTSQPGGSFSIRDVPPGHYYAFALERWSPVWQNTDFLREMESAGTSVDVQEFGDVQIQLPLTTAEQVQQVVARLGLSAQ